MRNNKEKWSFYNLPTRKELSAKEVAYWKNTLSKILKIGMEFEYNLPEKKNGTCKGDSNSCPCISLTLENDCWKKCINSEGCAALERVPTLCTNATGTCSIEDCEACVHFKPKCNGLLCPNFVSFCLICPSYKTDCKSCKYRFDPEKSPENIRKILQNELQPNNTYGQIGRTGVHSITTDGSLLGKKGAEIITVGRRVDYWEFYKMAKNIIDNAVSKGAYLNERCSVHMHALASYYGKTVPNQENTSVPIKVNEMERDMPEIILANLHQLVRRYQNAMTWMMMGLDDPKRLTRWEKFRVSVLPVSAVMSHMNEVRSEVSRIAGGNKYGWINYNNLEFGDNGHDVSRFHVEFRACDGMNTPSGVAAIACMYYALIIKAVEISRYGVVEIGDKDWLQRTEVVKSKLLNNMKGYQDGDRFADNSGLHPYKEVLIEESLDLVRQLKSILIKIGPAYEVLEKLAERPCAIRRVEGQTWEQIEKDLQVIMNEEGKFELAISEIITLNQVTECKDINEWITEVNNILENDPDIVQEDMKPTERMERVREFVDKRREDGEMIWSQQLGAPIII